MRDELVAALSQDNRVHAYSKWRGAFWRLISLADLGVDAGHPGAVAAAEETLAWVADPVRLADDVRVQADVHDPAGGRPLGVKLVEAEPEHVDAVARIVAGKRCSPMFVDVTSTAGHNLFQRGCGRHV